MTRSTLSGTNAAEVVKPSLRLEYMVSIAFPSYTLRAVTGDRDVTFGGNTYIANAVFAGFDGISEVPDLKGRRVSITLSGLNAPALSAVMNDKYHYAEVNLFIGLFNESWDLIADPHQIGVTLFMSNAVVTLGDKQGTVSISSETLEVFNRRNSIALATGVSQRQRGAAYATDTGMDNVRKVMEQEIEWAGMREGGSFYIGPNYPYFSIAGDYQGGG